MTYLISILLIEIIFKKIQIQFKKEPEIKEKNLIFLNECGLDPGIDHLLTMQLIHEAK
jgi:saccharopine dehydrogenase-like NADP-dependent oxidoreductase